MDFWLRAVGLILFIEGSPWFLLSVGCFKLCK